MNPTFGSAFAGIGGFDLGLERAGWECRWQIENDPFCNKVLEKQWPNLKRYGNIEEIKPKELEAVSLICGGFPCQEISHAGRKEGIKGRRSGLWAELYRIIRVLRPQFILVENVAAIAVRGLDVVLGDLAASGYDAEWQMLPAAAFGAPHIRDRCFVLAYPGGLRCNAWGTKQSLQGSGVDGNTFMAIPPTKTGWWMETEPGIQRISYGIPDRMDRLKSLGNAVVPQVAEWIGGRILASMY